MPYNTKARSKHTPDLIMDNQPIGKIGIWGWRRREYLKRHKPEEFFQMAMNDTLEQHLIEINRQASETVESIIMRTAELEHVNDELKRRDQMEWVRQMNIIRSQAEEFVKRNLIQC